MVALLNTAMWNSVNCKCKRVKMRKPKVLKLTRHLEGPPAVVTVGAPMFKRYLMAMEMCWLLFVEEKNEWFDVNVGVQLFH